MDTNNLTDIVIIKHFCGNRANIDVRLIKSNIYSAVSGHGNTYLIPPAPKKAIAVFTYTSPALEKY